MRKKYIFIALVSVITLCTLGLMVYNKKSLEAIYFDIYNKDYLDVHRYVSSLNEKPFIINKVEDKKIEILDDKNNETLMIAYGGEKNKFKSLIYSKQTDCSTINLLTNKDENTSILGYESTNIKEQSEFLKNLDLKNNNFTKAYIELSTQLEAGNLLSIEDAENIIGMKAKNISKSDLEVKKNNDHLKLSVKDGVINQVYYYNEGDILLALSSIQKENDVMFGLLIKCDKEKKCTHIEEIHKMIDYIY